MNASINCPTCNVVIELSETLAAPFIEAIRADLTNKISAAQAKAQRAETRMSEALAKIQTEREQIKTQISLGVAAKRTEIETEVRKQVNAQVTADVAAELKAKDDRIVELKIKADSAKVAEAEALKAKQKAEDMASELEVEILRRLSLERDKVRSDAKRQAEDSMRLEVAQLKKQLQDTNDKLVEAQRKAEQGPQQLQGEVAELDLESALCQAFPWDEIEEIKKGQRGADWMQHVFAGPGIKSGTILWESKRAQNWGGD